jgi:hypothetical protein
MPEFSLSSPAELSRAPITHPVHRATALLQEALHESRRATFTQEFGEIRGIHQLSAPPAAEVFVDAERTALSASPPANLDVRAEMEDRAGDPESAKFDDGEPALPALDRGTNGNESQTSDAQLRGLIRDFKERQRKAGLIVAGSVISAATLTVMTIVLVIALAA